MKRSIPQYHFYENKYGSELLVDVVELKYVKKFLIERSVHTLTYYDITFITEGEGRFSIDNQSFNAIPGDVFFSKPGEIRDWDIEHITSGYALIFEDEFLSSFLKDSLFVQHLSYFNMQRRSSKIHLSEPLYSRFMKLIQSIKEEIDAFKHNDELVLQALLYEMLLLLDRTYMNGVVADGEVREGRNMHADKFVHLVDKFFKEKRSVLYYADTMCITSNYLNEIMNAVMHVSAKQYIQNKVMDEAKRLLTYTDLPVSEIAFTLNYETASYFIRNFRQQTQMTPLVYRKEHKL